MARVFVSYDRLDEAKARLIAQVLERAGHFVWWDDHIKGGAEYGTEIEEALERAEAVVVLWSRGAVKSAWVRDEAAAGRDAGKLVPVRLDGAEPPMGFRQYQTIDLSRWKGSRSTAQLKDVDRAICSLAGGSRPSPPPLGLDEAQRRSALRSVALALAAVALIVAAWFGIQRASRADTPVVAVAAADTGAASSQLARDLFVKLGMLPEQSDLTMQLVEVSGVAPRDFDYLLEIGASRASRSAANLVLLAGNERSLLWSKDFELPADRVGDLKQQAAFSSTRVLTCAVEARKAGIPIEDPLTKRYLEGCAMLAEFAGAFLRPALPAFLEVTRRRPDFEEGWSKLLLTETQIATGNSPGKVDGPEYQSVRRHIVEARKRFPNNAAAYYAEIEMLPISATAKRLAISEKAVEEHPHDAFLLQQHALHLFRVGRVREAINAIRRASESDPLSARIRSDYIAVLAYGGHLALAKQELAKAEQLWPRTFATLDAASRVHQRFGDPRRALEIQRSGVFGSDPAMETFLLARIDPSPANINKAIAETRAMFGRDPRALGFYMQALGAFGREDELYAFFEKWPKALPVGTSATGTAGVLFREPLRKFRGDPRFMSVAKRFGIVDYWQQTGNWPDFCFEPDLPYDCKAEAAKLR